VDLLWPLGYLLIGLGAASTRRVKRSAVDDSTPAVPLLWQSMLPYVLLPPVVSLFVCTYDRMGDVSLARGVYYGASLLILLVIVRQAVAIAHLIDDLKERVVDLEAARKSLTLLAERDGLTGLYNHRTVYEKLDAILKEANGKPTSVIVMDMDDFKSINDVYGHPVGDDVLRHVTGILRRTSPDEAFLGRCGGDEFMIILPGHDGESAGEVALGLRKAIDVSPYQVHNGPQIPMHLCFGISDTIICGTSIASLISSADSALYEGKLHGGDQVTLHTVPSSDDSVADIGESSFDVLEGLVTTIDNKDHYTRRHSDDVCRYSLLLVEALGMSDDTQRAMRVAGLLHDVGKIGIPDAILRKPGRLTDQEYDVMKGHVTLSTLIIHGLPRLADILDGVSHHHERWDGTGYPNGLAGKEIPLLGRVMAIADAFSAMTLDRPYRVALKVGTALDEIEKGAGTQFDPELAKLFVESVRRRPTLTMTNDQARLRKAA
jgi:diguanylate cyclase (GGDEF)-like protein